MVKDLTAVEGIIPQVHSSILSGLKSVIPYLRTPVAV